MSEGTSSACGSSGQSSTPAGRKSKSIPATRFPSFREAIAKYFQRWTALKLAVQNGQGKGKGQDIADWMESALEDYFYLNANLDSDEVSEFLGVLMDQELETVVEDGSLEEISYRLCEAFDLCKTGKEDKVIELLAKLSTEEPEKINLSRRRSPTSSEASSGDEDMED